MIRDALDFHEPLKPISKTVRCRALVLVLPGFKRDVTFVHPDPHVAQFADCCTRQLTGRNSLVLCRPIKIGVFIHICGPTHVRPHVDGTVWVHTRSKCPLARTRSPLALWSLAAGPEALISLVRQVCHAYSWSNVASNEISCAFLGPPFLKPQLQHTSPFSQHGPNMLLVRDPPSGCSNCFRHRAQSDPSRILPSKSHSPRYTISNKHDQNTPYFTNKSSSDCRHGSRRFTQDLIVPYVPTAR